MLIDLHAKTHHSDGVNVTPYQLLEQAQSAGLDAIALCETLSSTRCREVLELAESDFEDISVFVGVEIPTDRGILLGFVPHIDEFYFNEEWSWLTHRTTPSADAVIDLFDGKNGIVVAARPYDLDIPFNMGDHLFEFDRIGAVEVFNRRVGSIQNNFALEAATFMNLGTTGGSDPIDQSDIGQYATFFEDDLSSQRLFVDAMRESEYWAVQIGNVSDTKGSKRSKKSRRSSRG